MNLTLGNGAKIHFSGGANGLGDEAFYIHSLQVDGTAHRTPWIEFDELRKSEEQLHQPDISEKRGASITPLAESRFFSARSLFASPLPTSYLYLQMLAALEHPTKEPTAFPFTVPRFAK